MVDGVSIIICCYNSAQRLPMTLKHLVAQEQSQNIAWEVIVVDNASTDNTADVARKFWPKITSIPLRVIPEQQPGLSHAREAGIKNAQFEYLSFIDDDNWVCNAWIEAVYDIMTNHPEVGACGGDGEAVCEIEPPSWFEKFKGFYAVGDQAAEFGDITETRGWLWGAGLTIRKSALNKLYKNGFQPMLTGRSGKKLTSGEDNEICHALCISGWRLWYDRRLSYKHYLPTSRLNWEYLRRLGSGLGISSVGLDPYLFALPTVRNRWLGFLLHSWYWQTFFTVFKLLCFTIRRDILHWRIKEGVFDDIIVAKLKERYRELIIQRSVYHDNIKIIRTASWRKIIE